MKTSTTNYQTNANPEQPKLYYIWDLRIYVIILFLIICTDLVAQSGLTVYTDAGKNNVSDGLFFKTAALWHYTFGNNKVEAGFEINLKNINNLLFSGFTINASRDLEIKGIPLELQGFYTLTRNPGFLRETNWGTLLKLRYNHFETRIGTNFRTYAFRDQVIKDFGIDKNAVRILENFNLMYSFTYYVKKDDRQWNAGLSITNIDFFIINQETNPIISLRGLYNPDSQVRLYTEVWYKTAGASNLNINYFGIYFRTGIIWNFN